MKPMSHEEWRRFLLERPRTAKAASTRADKRPHITPVWFDLDGDDLIFNTWHASAKARDLRRDPRISLCVDDDQPPFSFVTIEGTATLSEDPAELRLWAGRIGARYMGRDQAEAFAERNGVPGELLVRVTPTRVVAQSGITD